MEIFNLSITDLDDNSDLTNVSNKLNGKYNISKENNVILISEIVPISQTNIENSMGNLKHAPISPCQDYWEFEMPVQYAAWINSFFSLDIFLISEFDGDIYWNETLTKVDLSIFKNAGLACTSNGNYCICPSYECFIDNFIPLIDGDTFPETKTKLSKLSVQLQLNLSSDDIECLDQAEGLYNELAEILGENALYPVCNPSLTPEEMINNAIDNMAECSLSGFYASLSNSHEDYIINRLTDPRLKCIYKNLVSDSDEMFCNTFENFVGESDINLNLQNTNQAIGLGVTTPYFSTPNSPYGNIVDIALNENQLADLCEVTVVCVFLHEGIHAEMFRLLNDDSIDPEDFESIWDNYDTNISQHDNMASSYIDNLMAALKSRFGDRYTDTEYEAIAWIGLGDVNGEDVNTSAWNSLSPLKQEKLKEIFKDVNKNCNEDNCK